MAIAGKPTRPHHRSGRTSAIYPRSSALTQLQARAWVLHACVARFRIATVGSMDLAQLRPIAVLATRPVAAAVAVAASRSWNLWHRNS